MPEQKLVVEVDGHRVTLTNLDKVLYPATGFTKGDVLHYYAQVAQALVPLAAGRAATRKRWPDGVGTDDEPGKVFFVKNLEPSAPDWIRTGAIEHGSGTNTYPRVDDLATLTWLAQMATLEVHVPQWRFQRNGSPGRPDRMVLDLDPGEGAGLADCAAVAALVRPLLTGMGLDPVPVTSGSKGIHLYAALDGHWTSDQVTEVAHELARSLEADHPDLVVSDMKKERRRHRVLLDWSQNRAAKTTLVPYSLRGTIRPFAAAPRTWQEIASPALAQLEPHEVVARLAEDGDLLADLEPREARTDALSRYRSMRDPGSTPEPVPAEAPARGDGTSFVIQEHHARRLHWDFRLERDGVLVSWALPKGVPAEGERNHLAVHTEDHPLEYGSFEGDIPEGEYGGGHVDVWDAGTYEAEKFRDSEVIATLRGRPDGGLGGRPVKVALIRTGDGRRKAGQASDDHSGEQWLIHRMRLEAEEPALPATSPKPMLATLSGGSGPDPAHEWALEMKWDGVRVVAAVRPGGMRLTSRNDQDYTATYPELADLATALGGHAAVLDGEVVALDGQGRPSFGRLQQRMGLTKASDVAKARAAVAVRFFVFDLLELDGRSLTGQPWSARREALEAALTPSGVVQLPPVVAVATGDELAPEIAAAMATSLEHGLEGVVAKRTDSRYRAGGRAEAWLKLKHERQQEVVVAGWRPGNGRRTGGIGSLLLGVPDGERLRYVGRVGTGFTDRDLDRIAVRLRPLARTTSPLEGVPAADARDAHWVTPSLVGEVRFAEWTGDGRLRQPSWRGWRDDKRPDDVVVEA